MSVEYRPGGRRRIDQVLDPSFVEGLPELDDNALRARRESAQQEEADLSYLRRLLQGRLDLLDDERTRRTGGGGGSGAVRSDAELAEMLARVLGEETRTTRGSGRFLSAEPTRVGETRRGAERVVSNLGLSAPAELDDAQLAAGLERLRDLERTVSSSRRSVQAVEQRLSDELSRRLQSVV